MWYYNSQIIRRPKTMVIADLTYPQTLFNNPTRLAAIGIKPYKMVSEDNRYYTSGAYTVDTSGDEVIGTYAGVAKDLDTLKANMLSKANSEAASKHANIDWYWTRAAKGGTAVPSNIATYATALYSEHETIKTAIAACDTLAKVIAYENKPHTETRKVEVYANNGSMTYHASNTYTIAKHIDMTMHFSSNPTNEVDNGFVSLVAD